MHHGILNINKPAGMTSRDVVNKVQRLVRPAKVGHAGTLDPMATGILIVCVGSATRLIQFVQQQAKCYHATFLLNRCSDTDDITGRMIDIVPQMNIERSQIEELLPEFTGDIQQVPPAFSAVHVKGKRAYDLARQGKHVELKSRTVRIDRLELSRFEGDEFDLEIECGSGTYIRSIGRDLGRRLGCGAVMSHLERTWIGDFDVQHAIEFDEIEAALIEEQLQPMITGVPDLPRHECSSADVGELRHGRPIQLGPCSYSENAMVATVDEEGELVAICLFDEEMNGLRPKHVF